jgi:malonyl CoA-acyl carrier protein transacylase
MAEQKPKRKTCIVVCPGRGSYAKKEWGYLAKYGKSHAGQIARLDGLRKAQSLPTLTELDTEIPYSINTHTPGEHAADLIYGCSLVDYLSIAQERYEIVAVTGNSMGWYTALALAGALPEGADYRVIHTMGAMMATGVIGGQMIYPVVDDNWHYSRQQAQALAQAMSSAPGKCYVSINYGGYRVVGGEESALQYLKKTLPVVQEHYPMLLVNHAAFHTPLLAGVSDRAFNELPMDLFRQPAVPLVDGRGAIWQPQMTDVDALHHYTFRTQVLETYDFSQAMRVAIREFAPDKIVLLGPGTGLGGAVAQILIEDKWHGLTSKEDFQKAQEKDPYVVAMGRDEQRAVVAR